MTINPIADIEIVIYMIRDIFSVILKILIYSLTKDTSVTIVPMIYSLKF